MLVALYTAFLASGGIALAIGVWPLAIPALLGSLVIAARFELRWASDRAKGTRPRPVPPPATRVRR